MSNLHKGGCNHYYDDPRSVIQGSADRGTGCDISLGVAVTSDGGAIITGRFGARAGSGQQL